ncbi:hypothetical protein CHARACLAT_015430 [Characodon lateralis]|uniref:Uncharacterized protein n=1 Tax=Characodon lateralis TaxID=208331 RepID=A0ABU7EJK8_9TELE|nr:hypothetical protein [Characodon lateralis]
MEFSNPTFEGILIVNLYQCGINNTEQGRSVSFHTTTVLIAGNWKYLHSANISVAAFCEPADRQRAATGEGEATLCCSLFRIALQLRQHLCLQHFICHRKRTI